VTRTYALNTPPSGTPEEIRMLIGGKAANLGIMARDLGLPVPPGFVIATTACREYLASGWPAGLDDEVREQMSEVEEAVGRRFGEPSDPLLVSVRSGAPVSMPGMMDTVLNLGLNDATTDGLARAAGSEAFAVSCRERFEASFRSIVGVAEVPDDPCLQLRQAFEPVYRSCNSDRAIAYRRREGIPDDLGTAVTVQAMVFGNRGATSATGVLFTRNPATGEATLYGDVLFDAQGEDVVAGTHRTEPITALDERLPAAAAELRDHASRLERHFADLCDIEFTIEDGRLWMLQVRVGKRSPQATLRIAVEMAQDASFPLSKAQAVERVLPLLAHPPMAASAHGSIVPIVTGLPASPGLASGPIATSPEAAQAGADDGRPTILVRAETSPEDVHGMARAAGILTSRGGLASHAAVVARGWGIPAVVGAAGLDVGDGRIAIGERVLRAGDIITIDGSSGEVFEGTIHGTTEVVPEARILLEWARELEIAVGDGPAAEDDLSSPPTSSRKVTPDDCLRAVGIKGFAQPQAAADAVLASPDDVQPILDQLVIEGFLAASAGAYRLTETGTVRAGDLLDAERTAWGPDRAIAALDAFLELDHRMKDAVTAWQLRDDDAGAQVVNDHSDAHYDRAVLDRLAALHGDATAWMAPLESGWPRVVGYRARLARAIEQAVNGDQRFVASPRVDSYHGIWFELHEDLIQLAGRTREQETAAGRA
jgi:pyruvate,orthophosphate dikinase